MPRKMHSNREKAEILSQMTLRIRDVKILLDCGSQRASQIVKDFRDWFEKRNGYSLYPGQIPTEEFIKYAGIPEKRILRYAKEGF